MKNLLTKLWDFSGSVTITVILLLLLFVDLLAGFFIIDSKTVIFSQLNEISILDWAMTYGITNLGLTFWFFLLLILLFFLSINTFVCTTTRVTQLFKKRIAHSHPICGQAPLSKQMGNPRCCHFFKN